MVDINPQVQYLTVTDDHHQTVTMTQFFTGLTLYFCLTLLAIGGESALIPDKDSTKQKLVTFIDQNLTVATARLEQAVNINSGTLNLAGVKQVGQFYQSQFNAIGFQTHWVDGQSFGRAGHLVAEHLSKHTNAPKILLIGHLDTVFAPADAFQQYRPIDERYVAGPGITDMKGGNSIILLALGALQASGTLDQLSIKVVLTGDEERSGEPLSKSKAALIDAAKWADIALGFEDGDSDIKTAVIARRGSVSWELNVSGKPAHSSQIFQPEVGAGAIFETARILNEFREGLSDYGELTFNPGLMLGGTEVEYDEQSASGRAFGKSNVIAQTTKVTGGLRALTPDELAHAKQVMQNIVQQNLPHTSATLVIDDGYPPMAPTAGNRNLLALYSAASESLGFGPVIAVNPRNAGAADISFTAEYVTMSLDGLGLMGSGGHTKYEIADMQSFGTNAKKAAVLLYYLSQHKTDPTEL
ncbi:glutamate carboxypeptidase [Arenicella xantha]|uniref:Glutamate carboxypeptidase n=2 Tax=Arenicella xantha TaxID=644221 RepID=A0A395JL34_9GAMM|nr:glutamate carboxypeptidase [Arenicella xantha]